MEETYFKMPNANQSKTIDNNTQENNNSFSTNVKEKLKAVIKRMNEVKHIKIETMFDTV